MSMKELLAALAITVALALMCSSASAELVPRLAGRAVFDTEQNITWLADANYARTSGFDLDGQMKWDQAVSWVDNLSVAGIDNWRLPRLVEGCVGLGCINGELGQLYWRTFWNGNDLNASETSKFTNLETDRFYWYGAEVPGSGNIIRIFSFASGFQGSEFRDNPHYAWAVADGDVFASAVPLPGSLGLLGAAIAFSIVGYRRGRRASS